MWFPILKFFVPFRTVLLLLETQFVFFAASVLVHPLMTENASYNRTILLVVSGGSPFCILVGESLFVL